MNTSKQDRERYDKWCLLIPGYDEMDRNEKKAAKLKYKNKEQQMQLVAMKVEELEVTYDYCDDCEGPCKWDPRNKNKKEIDMYSLERDQKEYAQVRLYRLWSQKDTDLQRKYGLRDDDDPETAEEMIQRIKDGKYTIREDKNGWYSVYGTIRWRDPETKTDKPAYKEAYNEAEKVFSQYKDRVMLGTSEDALKALQEYEAL